ncbi:MAG: M43 family zinc metalloprotease [Myxococcota bacterium]|nr:PKD domain-containing protein [Deltaproteobacteria bacterium]MDQ3334413.1 M43 family zinc metalloprotease [Myxococcota bacterium]
MKTTALLVVLGLSGLVHAAPGERAQYLPDGKVRVGSHLFATANEYVNSEVFRAKGARCGSETAEVTADAMNLIAPSDCTMGSTLINPDYNDARVFVIQVVYHVIKKTDGVGDITPALLKSQIDVLNEDFNALVNTPGSMGTNLKIQFALARFDPQGNPHPGYNIVVNDSYFADPGSGLSPMKAALKWDTTRYLNVYTNDANDALGYATFPQQNAGTAQDGVVMLWNSVGRNSPIGPPYNLGRTMTHEVGHYLGLYHTFQGGCGTAASPYTSGDLVMDTNRESGPHFGCTAGASTCTGGAGMKPIENYMNYSDDVCMTKFTVEQANRARCSLVNYRTINTRPTAMFTSTVAQQTATFTNASTDLESQATLKYNWTFGDGTMSTDKNPTHTYTTAGTFNVTLEVVDPGSGFHTFTMPVTIEALPPPPTPDAGTSGPDGGGGGGGGDDDGGCCESKHGAASHALLALPVFLMLRRRRRVKA